MKHLSKTLVAALLLAGSICQPAAAQRSVRLQSTVRYNQYRQPEPFPIMDSTVYLYESGSSTAVQETRSYTFGPAGPVWFGMGIYYTYTAAGDTAMIDQREYDIATGAYLGSPYQMVYGYSAAGRTSATVSGRDFITGAMVGERRESYQLDNAGRVSETLFEYWDAATALWQKEGLYRYTYNTKGKVLSLDGSNWEAATGRWKQTFRRDYVYAANDTTQMQLNVAAYDPSTGAMQPSGRIQTLQTDAAGRITRYDIESYRPATQTYAPSIGWYIHYDAAGRQDTTHETSIDQNTGLSNGGVAHIYSWTGPEARLASDMTYQLLPDGRLVRYQRIEYRYEAVAPVAVKPLAAAGQLAVYPVPAGNTLNIKLPSGLQGGLQLAVTDALGRAVRTVRATTVSGQPELRLDLDGMPAGAYQLRLSDGKGAAYGAKFSVMQ